MSDLILIVQWTAPLVVFVGMGALQWRLIGALDAALVRSQAPALAKPSPFSLPDLHAKPAIPVPAPQLLPKATPVKPSGLFADAPPRFQAALHEIGFRETGNNRGIGRHIEMAHCGAIGDPWYAIFAKAMKIEATRLPGTRSPSSQSFRSNPNFVALSGPCRLLPRRGRRPGLDARRQRRRQGPDRGAAEGRGKSVTSDVVDVGPWNTNDPYWQAGTRPQAENGIDTTK